MKTRSFQSRRSNEPSDRLVASIQSPPTSEPEFEPPLLPGHDFSRVDLFSHAPQRGAIQTKLTIGAPGDQYEQEADRVAEQVVGTPDSAIQTPIQRQEDNEAPQAKALRYPTVQRDMDSEAEEKQKAVAVAAQEDEEAVQAKPLRYPTVQRDMDSDVEEKRDDEKLQTKPTAPGSSHLPIANSIENRLNSSKSNGSPLPDEVRTFMEPRFNTNFSQVRVHTGSEAVQLNKELQAQAFAHGKDIYFGDSKSPANDELTAHELTHVIQQGGAAPQLKAANELID